MTVTDSRPARLRSRLAEQVGLEISAVTKEVLVNSVLGARWMPRALRLAGYRAVGIRTATANIFSGLSVYGSARKLTVGAGTFVNHDCFVEVVDEVTIGRGCQIGPQVCIVTSHHPWTGDGRISRTATSRPVRVGDRVWIGARAVLLPGVTIGDDVAIAAGAVVAGDCLDRGVYAGVPARLIRRPPAGGDIGLRCPA